MAKFELNVRRMLCPMPVIKTQNKVASLSKNDELIVISTDPGSLHDIPSWCRINGHQVISAKKVDDDYVIHLKVQ